MMFNYIFQDILTLLNDIDNSNSNVWPTLSFDHYVLKRVLNIKSEWTCAYAAMNGHLNVLKWAKKNKCPWDEDTCALAAWNGHLEVLKWARENGCPWNWLTCASAAQNDHLEVLKWARENRCPE